VIGCGFGTRGGWGGFGVKSKSVVSAVKDKYGEDIAQALTQVAGEVEKSGNKDAAAAFEQFNDELQKLEPKKPLLKALWNGVVNALPTIATPVDVVSKIEGLFM
jgi:hypothetical protein